MSKAEDMGNYYRIPADNRDLNYSSFFSEGEEDISNQQDYTSHNTIRLSLDETTELIKNLDFVRESLSD